MGGMPRGNANNTFTLSAPAKSSPIRRLQFEEGEMPVTVHTVAVQMPQQLYSRLERLAELSRRSLESVVLQTLDSNIPPLPDDLPDEMRSDLSKLENLGDSSKHRHAHNRPDALWTGHSSSLALSTIDMLWRPEDFGLKLAGGHPSETLCSSE